MDIKKYFNIVLEDAPGFFFIFERFNQYKYIFFSKEGDMRIDTIDEFEIERYIRNFEPKKSQLQNDEQRHEIINFIFE